MTWSLSAAGHEGGYSEDDQRKLLKAVVEALSAENLVVSSFRFDGNVGSFTTLDEAKEQTAE